MSNEAGVVWWGRQDRRPRTFRAKAVMLLPILTRSLLLKGSITAMGQHESGRRLWFRAQLKPRTGWGVYGSSREAIPSYVKASESAATASWR
jgi:hypothetical protein